MGVIPNNKDEELLNYPKRENFWGIVKKWQSKGWEIAMHGYNHIYDRETQKKDFFGYEVEIRVLRSHSTETIG